MWWTTIIGSIALFLVGLGLIVQTYKLGLKHRWADWNTSVLALVLFGNAITQRLRQGKWKSIATDLNLVLLLLGCGYVFWAISQS